jgi:sugar lactone lactonase YvrE
LRTICFSSDFIIFNSKSSTLSIRLGQFTFGNLTDVLLERISISSEKIKGLMKKTRLQLVLITALLLGQRVAMAQFITGQNADVVLGQPNFTSGTATTTQSGMNYPYSVAVDPTTGKVFVADFNNSRVLRFSSAAAAVSGTAAEAVLGQPDFTSNGYSTTQSGMNSPSGVAVDASGNLYVSDLYNNRVLRFNHAATDTNGQNADAVLGQPDFTSSTAASSPPTQSGMYYPFGLVVDASGNLYVADCNNHRVLRFNHAASITNGANANVVLGQPNFASSTSATSQSGMSYPRGQAVDASGNLYVVEAGNNRVLLFNHAATDTNGQNADGVLGQPNFTSNTAASYPPTQSGMWDPTDVAVDASGNLYVADIYNHRVLGFANAASDANGANATVVLGQADFTTHTAVTTLSGMNHPAGVAVDTSGNLYVADASNNRVLRFNSNLTLPVELASFTAKPASVGIMLSWQTATEKNNAGFNIERSSDNAAFSNIGYVKGNGTTTQSHSYSFTDSKASGEVYYRLKQTDYNGTVTYSKAVEVKAASPTVFTLSQNYPNPFNPSTTISYALPQAGNVTLKVYDVLGREVATLVNENKVAGSYAAMFNADKFSSGTYFYKLQAGNFAQTKKMLLVK